MFFGGCRRRDGERPGLPHRSEQGGNEQVILDRAPPAPV
jgi:hypothetical protein